VFAAFSVSDFLAESLVTRGVRLEDPEDLRPAFEEVSKPDAITVIDQSHICPPEKPQVKGAPAQILFPELLRQGRCMDFSIGQVDLQDPSGVHDSSPLSKKLVEALTALGLHLHQYLAAGTQGEPAQRLL
jgi:hypothetical protein